MRQITLTPKEHVHGNNKRIYSNSKTELKRFNFENPRILTENLLYKEDTILRDED